MTVGELPRLRSVLDQLPSNDSRVVLNVGCGTFPSARTLHGARPGWALVGVDVDENALRRARHTWPDLRLLCADAIHLSGLLRARFGLILVRHPDVIRHRATWSRIIAALPNLLAPGGVLLVTVYAPEEVEVICALALPPPFVLDERVLAPVDLAGRDRFPLVYC
jgi:trans-aconitate methyltransferase